MERKEFLRLSTRWGACCAAVIFTGSGNAQTNKEPAPESKATPCEKRVQSGQKVIRRLISALDANVDEQTRIRIMENCGRACYAGAHGPRGDTPPKPEDIGKFLDGMRKYLGNDGVQQQGEQTVVYFKYTANPQGLKTADGYCLCPIFEDAPKDVSPTYCNCSVGYVKEIFERRTGKTVSVQLTNSVLRGGKTCEFTVRFPS